MTGEVADAARGVTEAVELYRRGRLQEALAVIEAALRVDPAEPGAHFAQGVILESIGHPDRAEAAYRSALEKDASHSGSWINLGRLMDRKGQPTLAAQCYDHALMIDRNHPVALANLGELFHRSNDLATARSLLEAAVAAAPDLPVANFNLGRVGLAEHRLDDARRLFDTARRGAGPAETQYADAFLLSSLCDPAATPAQLCALHEEWGQAYLQRLGTGRTGSRVRDLAIERRLVVGFLSGDFNHHPASRFLEPVFEHLDRDRIEVIAYHTLAEEDDATLRLRRGASRWRSAAGWDTDRLVRQIESDAVDILIDLSGHTRGSRFDVLARKPAPLQGEWLGYLHASGLPTIDFRIADPLMDAGDAPCGAPLLLPDGIWCYAPYPNSPDIRAGDPPLREADGRLVFGSFNNPMKINDLVLACWAKLLAAEPAATLTLAGFNSEEGCNSVASTLSGHGIAPTRLRFLPKMPIASYLEEQGRVDVALDPFPYGGGTTTFDSLWMGTPVVAMAGDRTCGRGSAAILKRLGLDSLVAADTVQYVEIARRVARHPEAVAGDRRSIRARLAESPMMSAPRFCRSLENALRSRWLRQ